MKEFDIMGIIEQGAAARQEPGGVSHPIAKRKQSKLKEA